MSTKCMKKIANENEKGFYINTHVNVLSAFSEYPLLAH